MITYEMINKILSFWFPNESYQSFWFKQDIEFDNLIQKDYLEALIHISTLDLSLEREPKKILACIILLDQFSRNINRIHRIDVHKFTEKAYELSQIWINNKYYISQPIHYTVFALMPLRHLNKLVDYELIIHILDEIKDKKNTVYDKFYLHTKRKLDIIKI